MENIQILEKLEEHDKRFDEHDKRFDAVDERLNVHDKKFDRVFGKLIEHDELFLEIKTDLKELKAGFNHIITILDRHSKILIKLDEERLVTHHRLEKLEATVFKE